MNHISRNSQARAGVMLENCEAIQFTFEPDDLCTIIVWRDRPKLTRPEDASKRLRDLRPGDAVVLPSGERRIISRVEIYR